jgi:hypothetical protein
MGSEPSKLSPNSAFSGPELSGRRCLVLAGMGEQLMACSPMPVMARDERYPSLFFARRTPFGLEFIAS